MRLFAALAAAFVIFASGFVAGHFTADRNEPTEQPPPTNAGTVTIHPGLFRKPS